MNSNTTVGTRLAAAASSFVLSLALIAGTVTVPAPAQASNVLTQTGVLA